MKVCIFQIKGQFAHWRKWFTTTSPLTYSFPPRTAVIGLIGAILGIDRVQDKVPEVFPIKKTHVAVCPLSPIRKDRLPENWRQTPVSVKGGKIDKTALSKFNEGFQANLEIIRNPCYRIIFWHKELSLMDDLIKRLKDKRWVYPPYLGILGFLANVEFEAEDEVEEQKADRIELHSILPLSKTSAQQVDLSDAESFIREERVPLDVLPGRRFKHLHLAYVQPNASPLVVKANELAYFHLKKLNSNVIFFESCI